MRFASYLLDGRPTFGAADESGGLVTLGDRLPGIATLRAAIERDALRELAAIAQGTPADARADAVAFLPLIPDPSKILCVGVNYRDHAEEGGNKVKDWPGWFIKIDESLVGHGQDFEAPAVSEQFDFEGELALVIGRDGRFIPEAEALSYVAGYTCFMDGSVRDYQKRCISAGKNFRASGSLGPYLVTADAIGDPSHLTLSTYLNGERMQHSGLDRMVHSVPRIIAYLSTITRLRPGDVIATGTPAGVGKDRNPPRWLRPGDELTVEIGEVGRLTNRVAAGATGAS